MGPQRPPPSFAFHVARRSHYIICVVYEVSAFVERSSLFHVLVCFFSPFLKIPFGAYGLHIWDALNMPPKPRPNAAVEGSTRLLDTMSH